MKSIPEWSLAKEESVCGCGGEFIISGNILVIVQFSESDILVDDELLRVGQYRAGILIQTLVGGESSEYLQGS